MKINIAEAFRHARKKMNNKMLGIDDTVKRIPALPEEKKINTVAYALIILVGVIAVSVVVYHYNSENLQTASANIQMKLDNNTDYMIQLSNDVKAIKPTCPQAICNQTLVCNATVGFDDSTIKNYNYSVTLSYKVFNATDNVTYVNYTNSMIWNGQGNYTYLTPNNDTIEILIARNG